MPAFCLLLLHSYNFAGKIDGSLYIIYAQIILYYALFVFYFSMYRNIITYVLACYINGYDYTYNIIMISSLFIPWNQIII